MFDPFTNILAVLIVIAAIALSAICIYNLDKKLFRKDRIESRANKAISN